MAETKTIQCPHCHKPVEADLVLTESETSKRLLRQRDAARNEVHRLEAVLVDRHRRVRQLETQNDSLAHLNDSLAASLTAHRTKVDTMQKELAKATKPSWWMVNRVLSIFGGK